MKVAIMRSAHIALALVAPEQRRLAAVGKDAAIGTAVTLQLSLRLEHHSLQLASTADCVHQRRVDRDEAHQIRIGRLRCRCTGSCGSGTGGRLLRVQFVFELTERAAHEYAPEADEQSDSNASK